MRVVIDGNIGCGKSTQIRLLEQSGFRCRKEPIDEWPLDLFYADPSRWGFALQMKILESFIDTEDDTIYERCMETSKYVFWWNLLDKSIVTDFENQVYQSFYKKHYKPSDVYIFLHSDPKKCYERISTRDQAGDNKISLEYIQKIDSYYQLWFWSKRNTPKFYTIDVEGQTPEQIHSEILNVLIASHAMQCTHADGKKVP